MNILDWIVFDLLVLNNRVHDVIMTISMIVAPNGVSHYSTWLEKSIARRKKLVSK